MKDNSKANAGPDGPRDDAQPFASQRRPAGATPANGSHSPQANGHSPPQRVSFCSVLDLVLQRWHWLILGTGTGAALLYLAAVQFVKPKFTANAQLLRFEAVGKSEYFKTTPVSGDTFAALIRAPELLKSVAGQAVPPLPPQILDKCIKVDPDPDSDIVNIQLAARDPLQAISLCNLYITNAVQYTRTLEAKQAAVIANDYLKKQLSEMDGDIAFLEDQFRKRPLGLPLTNQLASVGGKVNSLTTNLAGTQSSLLSFSREAQRLQAAQSELYDLLSKYTELNPIVRAKRQEISDLQSGLTNAPGSAALAAAAPVLAPANPEAPNPELDILVVKMRTLEDSRQELIKRQREAELYMNDPPGSVRVFAAASLPTVKSNHRRIKTAAATVFGAGSGLGASLLLVLLLEFLDSRLKTADDVTRVTKLPVLSALGDLNSMDPAQRAQWAFRAWTMLQGRLSPSPNFGLVCGITSSAPGEGRSTWVSLLAEAASMTGFRVLTIATRPSTTAVEPEHQLVDEFPAVPASEPEEAVNHPNQHPPNALTPSVLASPDQVTQKLTGPNSQPVVHIPLPGWVWNLERRKQWREALNQWRQIDNLVIFVELPPASVPEAVLLGSNLPNMLWLAQSGSARATDTVAQLETLRHARCHLVGAVLNKEPGFTVRRRFPRWLGCLALPAVIGITAARAQPQSTPASALQATKATSADPAAPRLAVNSDQETQTNLFFSIVRPSQRAEWQKHLTLGPGDVLTFNLYGSPELTEAEVAIGPDGRIGYLEAQDVPAAGLTIDELRAKLDEALGQYRRAPHTIITPVAFKSKKYYMLGKVTTKGVYTLDRPLTVLEALARAHGLESALVDRNLVTLTDFRHSFIARAGKRIPLDFEKLFQRGDLSQNMPVEPGDYIYFAPGDLNEVYVVGEIRLPGPVSWTPALSIIGAITARGGFTERAWRARVLVVRGSLSAPDAIAVDTHAILDAKVPNFQLRPGDIIYVNSRPFIKVEEAMDLATTAFIQSIITSWVDVDLIQPFPLQ